MSTATAVKTVTERTNEVDLVHESNLPGRNVLNNKGFAFYKATPESNGIVVEVVRKCHKTSRVRSSLRNNGRTFLVETDKLAGYVYYG